MPKTSCIHNNNNTLCYSQIGGSVATPSVAKAKYEKNGTAIKHSSTYFDHINKLEKSVNETFDDLFKHVKDQSVVEARRFHLMRHLAGKYCHQLIGVTNKSSAANDAISSQKSSFRREERQRELETAVFDGIIDTIKNLAPRGGGKLTNARSVLRR